MVVLVWLSFRLLVSNETLRRYLSYSYKVDYIELIANLIYKSS